MLLAVGARAAVVNGQEATVEVREVAEAAVESDLYDGEFGLDEEMAGMAEADFG